jgi:hypothetical protein
MQARSLHALRLHLASALCAMLPVLPPVASADWENGVLLSTYPREPTHVQIIRPTSSDILVVWRAVLGNTFWGLAQRLTNEGSIAPGWSAQGTRVALGSITLFYPFPAAHDGEGGVFVVQSDGADLYFARARGDGSDTGQLPLVATAAQETRPGAVSDGAGGAYVAWVAANTSVYLGRFQSDGSPVPGWPPTGTLMHEPGFSGVHDPPVLDEDGVGGTYVLWIADQARVLRVTPTGAIAAGWPAGGLVLGPAIPGYPSSPTRLFPSGEGRIAVWYGFSSTSDIVLMRFLPDGRLDPAWPAEGSRIPVQTGPTSLVSDGMGGVTVAWEAYGVPYVARVDSYGNTTGGRSPLDAGAQYVPRTSSGPTTPFALTTGPNAGVICAWNDTRPSRPGVRVRWIRADGTPDPSEPDTARVVGSTSWGPLRGLIDDGNGGAYLAWNSGGYLYMNHLPPSLADVEPRAAWRLPRPASYPGVTLRAIEPNPASRAVSVRVSLPGGAPASLELLDLAGRRLRARSLTGAGERTERLDGLEAIAPGIYLLRVTQRSASRSARLAIVR